MTTQERALTVSPAVAGAVAIYEQLNPLRNAIAPDLNDQELSLFAMVADRTGLDPFAKQIYAVKRKGKVTFQTGIDGYRSIAARTGLYDGQDEPEYGDWIEQPYGHPEFCTVRVWRKGTARPIAATAYWNEYKPEDNDFMWRRMPRVMLAKVAEALALRKAFPYDPERRQGIGADIYTADEMAQASNVAPPAPTASPRDRLAARKAALAPVVEEVDPDDAAAEAFAAAQTTEVVYREDAAPTTQGAAVDPPPAAAPAPPKAGRGSPSPRPAAPAVVEEPEGWFTEVSAVEQARAARR